MSIEILRDLSVKKGIPRIETYIIDQEGFSTLCDVTLHKNWGKLGIYSGIKNNPYYSLRRIDVASSPISSLHQHYYHKKNRLTSYDRLILGTTLSGRYVSRNNFFELRRAYCEYAYPPVIERQRYILENIVLKLPSDEAYAVAWEYINDPISAGVWRRMEENVLWRVEDFNLFTNRYSAKEVVNEIEVMTINYDE